MILAHKDNSGNVQSLQDHSFNVATKAREDANVIDQGDILFLLGLYHDLISMLITPRLEQGIFSKRYKSV